MFGQSQFQYQDQNLHFSNEHSAKTLKLLNETLVGKIKPSVTEERSLDIVLIV